jgi:endonuclease/exonuclease/phosphatase family metal-dependent hydrolase
MKSQLLFLLFCLISQILTAQSSRIFIDEEFDDWQHIQPLASDPSGDNNGALIDFGRLWITNDAENVYLRIEVGGEINLQNDNSLTLYLDTDNNAGTGIPFNGMGSELVYNFGARSGDLTLNGVSSATFHDDIELVSSPTVTSTQFELAISRNVSSGGQSLFGANSFKIALIDRENSNYDRVPDNAGGVLYQFNQTSNDSLPPFSIAKTDAQHLRVLSYNVLSDNLFENGLQGNFRRIIQAISPNIIGFQEIYSHSSAEVAAKMESFLPSNVSQQWYHGSVQPDVHAISRYPIIGTYPIPNSGNGAFLIDLGEPFNEKLLFIVAHPPCCSNNIGRQDEIDAMMGFIREAKNGQINGLNLPDKSPIIIAGDMNLVGFRAQLETFLTGDIANEAVYGPDFTPDWDGSSLEDTKPFTTGLPMTFTWYRETSSFSPGRLDYIVYSGSVLNLENSYSLFTPALSNDSLSFYNLQADDVVIASDHLPLVADFSFEQEQSTSIDLDQEKEGLRLRVFPNPVRDQAILNYFLPETGAVSIDIMTIDGKVIREMELGNQSTGEYEVGLDLREMAKGVYIIQLITDSKVGNLKLIIE